MARLLRESNWRDLAEGDTFRVAGLPGKRFRFRGFVTNFENGESYVDAVDVQDGRLRAFRPDRTFVKDKAKRQRRAAKPKHARAPDRAPGAVAPTVAPTLFD